MMFSTQIGAVLPYALKLANEEGIITYMGSIWMKSDEVQETESRCNGYYSLMPWAEMDIFQ